MAFNSLASLAVTIGAQTKQLDNTLRDVKSQLAKIDGMTVRPKVDINASALGAAIAIWESAISAMESMFQKIVTLMPKAAFAADDLEMAMHRVKIVFQGAKGQVTGTIDELSNIGYARTKVTGLAADMGLMLHGMGLAERKSADLTSQLLKMATNAEVVYGVPLPEFMEKLEASIAGMPRALKRIGINFDEWQVKQEALEMIGRREIAVNEEQQLRWARLSLIMKQGAAMAGQAAWAHKTLGGQFRETQGRLHGLLVSFGEAVKPAFIKGFMAINDMLKQLGGEIEANKGKIKGWIDAFVEKATTDPVGTLKAIWETLGATISWIWKGVWDKIITYGTAAFEYFGHLVTTLLGNVATEIQHRFENVFKGKAWASFADVPGGFLWNAKKFSEFLPKNEGEGAGEFGPKPSMLSQIFGFFKKPLAPMLNFLSGGKAAEKVGGGAAGFDPRDFMWPANKLGPVPVPGHEAKILADRLAMLGGAAKGKTRLDPNDFKMVMGHAGFQFAEPIPGRELKIAADKLAIQAEKEEKRKGKKPAREEEGEPTPALPPTRPGIGPGTPGGFVGLTEFAKQIQMAAFGDQDKQLSTLLRIANSAEYIQQMIDHQTALRQAQIAVAGPH